VKYEPKYANSSALVVGINKYRHVGPLEIARADAEAIRDVLINEFAFPKKNVRILLDAQATRDRIMDEFLENERLSPDDRLIFFFAGHGHTVDGSRGAIGYLVPVDGDLKSKSSLIRWDELTRNADIIPAKHIWFIMDACYSGLAMQRGISPGERRFISDMLQRRSRQVITAGKADESVADGGGPEGGNSIFTGHLLDGMRGAAAIDGVMTASDIMNYAYRKVARDAGSHQTPAFGHIDGDGEFVLLTPGDLHADSTRREDFLVKTIAERPEAPINIKWDLSVAQFGEKNGYADPNAASFGRNEWSQKLGEYQLNQDRKEFFRPAFGWLGLTVEPATLDMSPLDLASVAKSLPKGSSFHTEDDNAFVFPSQAITTANSLILFEPEYSRADNEQDCWSRFLRIDRSGALEYCDYSRVARLVQFRPDTPEFSVFLYVQIIGTIWTFLKAAQRILTTEGYTSGVKYAVNLIGTKDTVLVDLAHGVGPNGKHWIDPFNPGYHGIGDYFSRLRCRDSNLQFVFKLVLGSLRDNEIKNMIVNSGEQFGLAYNHQSARRCFNADSDEFPWTQYRARE
jgi:hypothetical protein